MRLAPKTYGACGRLIIMEHGGKLLSNYLYEPFAERAELALQLLSLVQVFWVRFFLLDIPCSPIQCLIIVIVCVLCASEVNTRNLCLLNGLLSKPDEMLMLQHADRRWFALYKDFVFENIAVSHEKEIFIVDFEELSIVENADFDEAHGL